MKYSYHKNHEIKFSYSVVHEENGLQTMIALTDTAEKADLLVKACNAFTYLNKEVSKPMNADIQLAANQIPERRLFAAMAMQAYIDKVPVDSTESTYKYAWSVADADALIAELDKPH